MSSLYKYTSGKMLHYQDCLHFYDEMPARLATDEELRTLEVCNTCAGAAPTAKGPTPFTCPQCHLILAPSMRVPAGICRDCADG